MDRLLAKAFALTLCFGMAFGAAAQSWPTRSVQVVVPFAPGGVADSVARLIAQQLSPRLGQPVIVDNKTGAGGSLAATQVSRAAPDGHVLLLAAASHASLKALYPNLSFEPIKSFEPVTGLAAYPVVLLVRPDSPYRSADDLIKDVKARPGKLNNANPGAATVPGLAAMLVRKRLGLDYQSVPYKGSSPALIALMSGETEFAFNETGSSLALIKGGKLRPLVVLNAERLQELPEVPAADETVLAGLHASAWLGVLAPRGTPQPVVDRLHKEIGEIMASPAFLDKVKAMGGAPLSGSPAKFSAFLADEVERWGSIITAMGLKAD